MCHSPSYAVVGVMVGVLLREPLLAPLSKTDAEILETCSRRCFLDPYDPPWTRATYSGLMRAGAFGWKIVVEKNQNDNSRYLRPPMVGFIFLQNSVEVFEILKLAVCPEYRHQGLARKLLTQTQNFAVTRQLPLTLEVSEHNVPARSLYSKSGFQEIARRPNYYASAVAACILKWP